MASYKGSSKSLMILKSAGDSSGSQTKRTQGQILQSTIRRCAMEEFVSKCTQSEFPIVAFG